MIRRLIGYYKNKKGLAKEGIDIFTCGMYEFCSTCGDYNFKKKKPCCFKKNRGAKPIMTFEELLRILN